MARRAGGPVPANGLFTTHQVAKVLGVSMPTVVNWCNQGKLRAIRTPGGHRRIPQEELIRFSEEQNFPLPVGLAGAGSTRHPEPGGVLIVSSERDFVDLVFDFLKIKRSYDVRVADHPLTAGVMIGRYNPRVMIWDEDTPGLNIVGLTTTARESGLADPRIILTTDFLTHEHRSILDSGRLQTVLQKPVALDILLESLDRAFDYKD